MSGHALEGFHFSERRSRGLAATAARRFFRNPLGVTSLLVLMTVFTLGALAHVIAPENPIDITSSGIKQPPSFSHPFGTDAIGRDMLIRTLWGVQTSAEVALAGALLATFVGVLVGALTGYFSGWLDAAGMRIADLVTAYPAVVLSLAAIVYLGEAYPHNLILVYGAIMWAVVARVVRAQVVALRSAEFVDAARALGASNTRIVVRHLLPNAGGTILLAATALVGQIILIDATVEFFSYGLPSAVSPSLGNLVSDVVSIKFGLSNDVAVLGFGWWTWVFPGLTLVLILVCVNLLGDALDAAVNPVVARR